MRCFASDIRVVSDTLKCFNMLGLYMSKDSGVNPTFPHVATKDNSSASVLLGGVAELELPTARLEVSDTGREIWVYEFFHIPLNIHNSPISVEHCHYSNLSNDIILIHLTPTHNTKRRVYRLRHSMRQTYWLTVDSYSSGNVESRRNLRVKSGETIRHRCFERLLCNSAIAGTTTGSRILKDVSAPTVAASYLTMGANFLHWDTSATGRIHVL